MRAALKKNRRAQSPKRGRGIGKEVIKPPTPSSKRNAELFPHYEI